MAISTINTYLKCKGTGSIFETLVPIKSFSDLGGQPSQIEVTTMSNLAQVFVDGVQEQSTLTFVANYTKDDYDKVKTLDNGTQQEFEIHFGLNGENGIFEFAGTINVYVNGGSVNSAVEMTITITPSTEITIKVD